MTGLLITGRYRVAETTELIWRGPANQRLRTLTELGRRRYRPFLEAEPARPPIQVHAHADGVRVVGVPLAALERALRRDGSAVDAVSWRPATRPAGVTESDQPTM